MKVLQIKGILLIALLLCTLISVEGAATYYVDAAKPDDTGDGTSWVTAKHTIQGAIDITVAGDTVMVTNGVYNEGGAVSTYGATAYALTNRVHYPHKLTIQAVSTNPADTVIVGAPDPDTGGLGPKAIRCVQIGHIFLPNYLIGFTLTNGYTLASADTGNTYYDKSGGGFKGAIDNRVTVSNCVIVDCHSGEYGGGGHALTLKDSVVKNCTAKLGGGLASMETVDDCIISGNSSSAGGGGVSGGIFNDCILSNNTANSTGGGAGAGVSEFFDCVITDNVSTGVNANAGAITISCNATRCIIRNNYAVQYGGVTYGTATTKGTYVNCLITGNRAGKAGGISFGKVKFVNCTMVGNTCDQSTSATYAGVGGCRQSFNTTTTSMMATNCIIYGNTDADGENNYMSAVSIANTLTYPDPTGETYDDGGNITGDPKFVGSGSYQLTANSPAVNAGLTLSYVTTDIIFVPRPVGKNDMGCYESGFTTSDGTVIIIQ